MKNKALAISVAILILAGLVYAANYLALFTPRPESSSPAPSLPTPQLADDSDMAPVAYVVEEVARGLYVPWSLVFTSADRLLVSERSGSIRVIERGSLKSEPLVTFKGVSHAGEEGLMGLAKDPDYETNRTLYACLAYASANGLKDKVISFTDNGASIGTPKVLIDNIPAARNHAGCRLFFLPDSTRLITTGDASNRELAQSPCSLGGKILRLNRDGSIPSDNPFKGSPVYTTGHRNPQGLAFDTDHMVLWETEHGPSVFDGPAGGDEVNLIESGKNYGWPLIHHKQKKDGLESPHLEFTPAVAPGSLAYYNAAALPQFKSSLFFGALRGEGIYRLSIDRSDPRRISGFEKLKDVAVGRVRDIVVGPDGNIYFTTSNRDGRGRERNGDDKIYRLAPRLLKE